MLATVYEIIISIIYLCLVKKGKKTMSFKEKLFEIFQVVILTLIVLGYAIWFVYCIIAEHMFTPDTIVAFLVAQETVVSGTVATVSEVLRKVVYGSNSSLTDLESNEESDSDKQ